MTSCVLSSCFEPLHIYHGVLHSPPSTMFFLNQEDVTITREFFDHLSTYTYDGEGEVAWPEFLHDFLSMLHEEDGCSDEQANLLLAYTLVNPHISGCAAYWLTACTCLSTFVISLKTLSIILVQNILTKN